MNPLFIAFVTELLLVEPRNLDAFRDLARVRLGQWQGTDEPQWGELEWYSAVDRRWSDSDSNLGQYIDDRWEIEDLKYDLEDYLRNTPLEEMVKDILGMRYDLMIESRPYLGHKLKSLAVVYQFCWEDGRMIEYASKPSLAQPETDVGLISSMLETCMERIGEVLISPGLDQLHNQASKEYDSAKMEELLNVMHDYVADMPYAERRGYLKEVARLENYYGGDYELEVPSISGDYIERSPGAGGFRV